ncbi:MAG: hypothetical protein WBP85_05955, partial [Terracidiphilus sp.]
QSAIGPISTRQGVELRTLGSRKNTRRQRNNRLGARKRFHIHANLRRRAACRARTRGDMRNQAHCQFHTVRLIKAQAAFWNRGWFTEFIAGKSPRMRRQRMRVRERLTRQSMGGNIFPPMLLEPKTGCASALSVIENRNTGLLDLRRGKVTGIREPQLECGARHRFVVVTRLHAF